MLTTNTLPRKSARGKGDASPSGRLQVNVKKNDMSSFLERIPTDSLKHEDSKGANDSYFN